MKMNIEKVSDSRKRKCKAWILTLFFILGCFQNMLVCQASEDAEEKTGNLYARSAVLMDGDTGRVLLGKEEDIARPMASTTKILTCIIALEDGWKDGVVPISALAQSQPKVHAGVQENEQYFLEDLLYSLMLESHNDSAVAIAEYISGSVEAFAEKMNQKAAELGCTTANFITPNGLDASNENGSHSISAEDLAKIMRYCVWESPKADEFLKITQTRSYSFQEITGKRTISCTNHNSLLDMNVGAVSGKTGFTGEAGYCYIGAVERDGKKFVISLLACGWPNNKNYKWKDAKQLVSYGAENYFYENVWKGLKERILVEEGVENGLFDEVYTDTIVSTSEESLEILKTAEENVTVDVEIQSKIEAPVKVGEKVGNIKYYIEEDKIAEYEIITTENIKRKDFLWTAKEIFAIYINH